MRRTATGDRATLLEYTLLDYDKVFFKGSLLGKAACTDAASRHRRECD